MTSMIAKTPISQTRRVYKKPRAEGETADVVRERISDGKCWRSAFP